MEPVKIVLITQARVGSTRFPHKVTQPVGEATLLGLHIYRVLQSSLVRHFVVATTMEDGVETIVRIAGQAGAEVYQGNLNDVLDRFYQAARPYSPDYVVRVTSDCPLIDAALIDAVIQFTLSEQADYGSNGLIEEFPDGQDIEVFRFDALETAWREAVLPSDREHVTPYIRKHSSYNGGTLFKSVHFKSAANYNHIRMTVDEPADLQAIQVLVSELGVDATWLEYTEFIVRNARAFENQNILRNEGYVTSLKRETS